MRPHVCRTRNRSTSKKSRLNKFDPVHREGGSQVCRLALRLRSTTLACSQVCRLALRLGSSTLAWAQNDGGCTRRLRLWERHQQRGYPHRVGLANQRFAQLRASLTAHPASAPDRKSLSLRSRTCSAEGEPDGSPRSHLPHPKSKKGIIPPLLHILR